MTKKKQNGITLIALVITIVVLLILAGVSIMTLTGDNGLLTRTTTAKQKTEEAGVIENIRLAYQSAKIGEYAGETGDFATKFQMELAKVYSNPTVTQGENGTYTVGVPEGNFIVNSTGSVEKKSGVLITTKPTKIKKGEKIDLTAILDGVTGNITWETSDSDVISVTSSGRIEGKADSGRATITAKIDEEHKDEFTINIAQKITAISVEDITVSKNNTAQIVVTTTPTGIVEDMTYTFSSDKTNIATVNENTGLVTGVATGEATITITSTTDSEITTTCKVTVPPATVSVTAAQIAASPSTYYGQEVLNYTKGGTYRIFFVDEKTTTYPNGYFGDIGANEQYKIYLKADWTANDVNLSTEGANTYTPIDTTKLAKMNPSWWSARSTATWNANEKCAAYLCDPTTSESTSNQEWAAYFDSGKADYVIGSPSVEMYVKSYNQAHGTPTYLGASYRDDSNVLLSGTSYRTQGYIYTINGGRSTVSSSDYYTGTDTLDYENFNSMYCGKQVNSAGTKGEYYWWLASPSANYSLSVCCVYGNDARLGSNYFSFTYGVCPLVSLKSNFTPQISE